MTKQPSLPVILILALWTFWAFGYNTVFQRLMIDVDGTITASVDRPSRGAPRYATDYTIRTDEGREIHYTAGSTDASLDRSLPVGASLRKIRWELGYEVSGRWVSFPAAFYVLVLGLAAVAIGYAVWQWFAGRHAPMTSH